MYQIDLLRGQRILVTGGGTGLGRAMAERFLALGADIAICGRRQAVCDETAAVWRRQFPGRRIDAFGVDIRVAQAVDEMVDALWQSGGLTGLVNNAAGNFIAPTETLSPRAFDAIANIVFHGTFYVTQAVGKRWVAAGAVGRVEAGRAVSQRDEHHRHLGRQRQPVRGAERDEQGRHRGDDQVAGGRMGALRHPAQRGGAGRDSHRRHEQAPQSRRGARRAQPRAQPDGAARARSTSCRTWRRS